MFLTAMSNVGILMVYSMRVLKLIRKYSYKHAYEVHRRLDTEKIYQNEYGLCFK